MRVHLIKERTIQDYSAEHAPGRSSFEAWLTAIEVADFESPEDILSVFSSADLLGNGSDRVVFNIGGNKYRLICKYRFGLRRVRLFVCWIGTHAEYNELCKKQKQYTVQDY
jgi:mRNA interferase HigB